MTTTTTTTLYAAALAARACEDLLADACWLGLTEVPCSLDGWRAAKAAGLAEEYLVWAVYVLPPAALPVLAADPDWRVRFAAAGHRACPAEVLAELAEDGDWRVRQIVAGHPACPAAVLAELAEDPHVRVQMVVDAAVAGHPA